MKDESKLKKIEKEILSLVEEHSRIKHKKHDFLPEISTVPINGRVFDSSEIKELVKASLDFWLTDGEYSEMFSEKMSKFLDMKHVRIVNSGSSANLVALSSLTSSTSPSLSLHAPIVIFWTSLSRGTQSNLTTFDG